MSERDLWQAVLMSQIEDAISAAHIGSRDDKNRRSAEARHYLTTPSKDLETVCSFAGVDMEALIDRMRVRIAVLPPVEIVRKAMGRPPKQTPTSLPPARITPKPEKRPARAAYMRKTAQIRGKRIDHADQSLTVKQWSAVTGIPANAIHNRLRSGWTVADALTVKPDESHQFRGAQKANRITHTGETLTYRQWAERTGLSWFTIRERVNKGWPVEEVLRPGDNRGAHMRVETP